MRKSSLTLFALAGSLLLGAVTARAQDSGPLIDLLIRKGIITDAEGESLRAELVKDFAANTSAGKLNLAANDTDFKIAGDVRARFESRTGKVASGDHSERDRFRYRLRGGITARVLNDWLMGIRLETATGNRSSNVTMGDDAGPFAKTSDLINVGQIYAQWNPTAKLSFTAGRMPNPLVTTAMTWDADINPEGLAESFRQRDGNNEYSLTAAQFLYSAASTQNAFGSSVNVQDLLLLSFQGGYKFYKEGATNFFQVNPTFYTYARNNPKNPAAFKGTFTPTTSVVNNNLAAVNNLFVFDMPVEYDWLIEGVPARVFGDFAVNLDGSDRARKWGRPDLDSQKFAYQIGFQYGKATNRGEWDAKVYYQSVGIFALDPNLVDSDIFDSRTNMQGFVFNGNYALGASTQLTLTLAQAKRKDSTLIAPGTGDVGTNNALDRYTLLQFDLNLKF